MRHSVRVLLSLLVNKSLTKPDVTVQEVMDDGTSARACPELKCSVIQDWRASFRCSAKQTLRILYADFILDTNNILADTVEPRPRRTVLHFTAITWLQVTTNTSVSLCGHIQMFFWTCLPFRLSLTWREAMGVVISHTEKESLLLMLNLIDPKPPNKLFRLRQPEE